MTTLSPSQTTTLHLAHLASFPPALLLAGYTLTLPTATLPSLLPHRPQTTTPAFTTLWRRTAPILTTLTLLSTSASAYLAYTLPAQRRVWLTAAVSMFLTIPWTSGFMVPGIRRLGVIAGDERTQTKSEMNLEHRQVFVGLVKRGYVLVALQVVSAVTGLLAVVKA